MTTQSNNKPVDTLRDGSLKIAIWKNDTEHGVRYSTGGVVRSYKDKSDQWQETRDLSNGELLKAARLLNLAYDRIAVLRAEE